MSTPSSETPGLSQRVARLFDVVLKPDGQRYSGEEVARSVSSHSDATISANYVYLLRTGRRDNPTKRHLEALARFFDVPPAYFFDEGLGAQIYDELELVNAMRSNGVRAVALRAASMSPRGRKSLLAIMEQLDELAPGVATATDARGGATTGDR